MRAVGELVQHLLQHDGGDTDGSVLRLWETQAFQPASITTYGKEPKRDR